MDRLAPPVPQLPPMPASLAEGLCASGRYSRDLWSSHSARDRQLAIRICERCPVQRACAGWSLALPDTDRSVWGGLTVAARVRLRRQREAAAAPAA